MFLSENIFVEVASLCQVPQGVRMTDQTHVDVFEGTCVGMFQEEASLSERRFFYVRQFSIIFGEEK